MKDERKIKVKIEVNREIKRGTRIVEKEATEISKYTAILLIGIRGRYVFFDDIIEFNYFE